VAVFIRRHRTWLRWPKRGSWRWVVAVVLIGQFLFLGVAGLPVWIHLVPYLNPVTYGQSLPQANLQQQFLAAGVQADLLRSGVKAPVREELTRLGTHLLGVHPLANAALFAIAHRSTDPLTVRDQMIEAAGRQMLRDPPLGHKSLDLANDERVVKQMAFARLLSFFLAGLLLYWLLIRSQSIWPPLAAHMITNVIGVLT
jgi:membrane protease YdiL (CAAX protease family)